MVKWLMRRGVQAFERKWDYDAAYLRDMIDASPRGAWLFSRAAGLGAYRRDVPPDAWSAAALVAVRAEDCGPCTQLAVTMAERSGVAPAVLRAVRAHGNAAETIPVGIAGLTLLALLDPAAPLWLLHAGGLTLTAGRALHAVGLSAGELNAGRVGGMALTILALLLIGGGLVYAGLARDF